MKVSKSLLALIALVSSVTAFSQEPVVGVADPESLFVDDDPALHRNKQATLHIMRELLQCNQWDRAGEWLTERYIQHNPNAASGLAGVVYFFTQVMKRERTDSCPELTLEIAEVMAEDDLVTVLWPRTYPDPRTPEYQRCQTLAVGEPRNTCLQSVKTYSTTWFDTWRFVDGKADEHWDPATIAPPAPAPGN
jgi:predicted SnoaL-like aldol condensation-catalyzing enzyme